jgi:hypothetical protein
MPAVLRLVQGTGVWYSTRRLVKSLFVQLVRVQCVMPPVPERFFAYGGCDPNGAHRGTGISRGDRVRSGEPVIKDL